MHIHWTNVNIQVTFPSSVPSEKHFVSQKVSVSFSKWFPLLPAFLKLILQSHPLHLPTGRPRAVSLTQSLFFPLLVQKPNLLCYLRWITPAKIEPTESSSQGGGWQRWRLGDGQKHIWKHKISQGQSVSLGDFSMCLAFQRLKWKSREFTNYSETF